MITAKGAWSGLAAALAVAAASVAFVLASHAVPPMDDTYIHLAYGRSLASGHLPEFNAGEPSSGFTSPLWLIPSALASTRGDGAASVLMLSSTACACLAVALCGVPAAAVAVLTGPLLFHSSSGMETALACLFAVLLWRSLGGRSSPLGDGLLLCGAILTRPEFSVLAPVLLIRHRGGGIRSWSAVLAPSLGAAALWAAWNLHCTGLLLPSTFYAKQAAFPPDALLLLSLAWRLAISAPLVLPAAAAGVILLIRSRSPKAFIAPLLLLSALATQPDPWFQLRYYVPALFVAGLTASEWLDSLAPRRRVTAAAIVLCASIPGMIWFGRLRVQASADVRAIDVEPALFVAEASSPGDVVAAADIGAMKWLTNLHVIDLDGLVTIERLPGAGRAGWGWLGQRADWLVAFPAQYRDLVTEADGDLERMALFESPSSVICGEASVAVWKVSDRPARSPTGSGVP